MIRLHDKHWLLADSWTGTLAEDRLELVFTKNKQNKVRLLSRIAGRIGVVKNNTISEKVKYLVTNAKF